MEVIHLRFHLASHAKPEMQGRRIPWVNMGQLSLLNFCHIRNKRSKLIKCDSFMIGSSKATYIPTPLSCMQCLVLSQINIFSGRACIYRLWLVNLK